MRIWTIGHSTRTIDDFISLLKENEIKLLVDVRAWPGSKRYPQFNKDALAESLNVHGIRYEHFPELGGKRKSKPDSRNTAWRNASFRGYADYMETEQFQKGIERLLDVAGQGAPAWAAAEVRHDGWEAVTPCAIAIMCAEAVWWRCHRRIVADHLILRGEKVFHLMDKDGIEEAVMTPGAKALGPGLLHYPRASGT